MFLNRITLLTLCAICAPAQNFHPTKLQARAGGRPAIMLALDQADYHLRAGDIVAVSAPEETVDFVRTARSCVTRSSALSADDFTIGLSKDGDDVGLALIAGSGAKPGNYTVSFSAESETGERRVMTLHVRLDSTSPAKGPMVVAPTGSEAPIASTDALIAQGWVVPGAFSQPTRAPELQTEVESKFIPGDVDVLASGER